MINLRNSIFFCLSICVLTISCKNQDVKKNLINSHGTSSENEKVISTSEIQNCEKKGFVEEINKMVLDTTSLLTVKFEKIFSECLYKNDFIKVEFLPNSLFNELRFQNKKSFDIIENYSSLKELINKGKIDLSKNSIEFNHINDSLEYYALEFKNGIKDTMKYNPNDWGIINFRGYLPAIDYFWFQVSDHGTYDFVIDAKNGKKANFVPISSPNNSYFFQVNTEFGYGDIQYVVMIIGKDIHNPMINMVNEYSPFYSSEFNAKFEIDDVFWINNNEFVFNFFHIWEKNGDLRKDTIYYKDLKVKISINTP